MVEGKNPPILNTRIKILSEELESSIYPLPMCHTPPPVIAITSILFDSSSAFILTTASTVPASIHPFIP